MVTTRPVEDAATEREFTIKLDMQEGYRFDVGLDVPDMHLVVDETPPIGDAAGPGPTRMLATSIGHCLASSALFCLRKARVDVKEMSATVKVALARNESGRLRVGGIQVALEPVVAEEDVPRMKRCLEIFEDFCVVTQSVRGGLDVTVDVAPQTA